MARISLPDGSRVAYYGTTRRAVVDKLQEATGDRRGGRLVAKSRVALSDWLDQWLEDFVKPGARESPRTYETYASAVRVRIKPELGHLQLGKLSSTQIQHAYARLSRRYTAKSVNFTHTVLSMALEQARRVRLIGFNPCNDVKPPPRPRSQARQQALPAHEILAFNRAIAGHPYEHCWRVLLATGVRWGELAALRWSDVDLDAPHITIDKAYTRVTRKQLADSNNGLDLSRLHGGMYLKDPKTPREAPIPLVPDAVVALKAQRARIAQLRRDADEWHDLDLVFPNLSGDPLRNNNPLRELKAVLKQAGLAERTLRGMRHTFATQLFARGVHVKAAQQLLGHSRPDMTLSVYTGSVSAVLRDAMASMADLFGEPATAN